MDSSHLQSSALFDRNIPTSLYGLLPEATVNKLHAVVAEYPDLEALMDDEDSLLKEFGAKYDYHPTVSDKQLRHAFWLEYENALYQKRPMVLRNVHSLVCSDTLFNRILFKGKYKAIFILSKPRPYLIAMNEMIMHGIRKLRSFLDMPIVDSKGRPNVKLMELQLKVTAMADMRINGAPTQKIQQLNASVQIGKSDAEAVSSAIQKGDMITIRNRLMEIEREVKRAQGVKEDVEAEIVEPESKDS